MAALATDSLRRESRRIAIAREWESYQSQEWLVNQGAETTYQPKTLIGKPVAKRHASSWTERLRADRFVDAATKATLEYVEAAKVEPKVLRSLWGNVYYGQNSLDEQYLPISLRADELIVELIKKTTSNKVIAMPFSLSPAKRERVRAKSLSVLAGLAWVQDIDSTRR